MINNDNIEKYSKKIISLLKTKKRDIVILFLLILFGIFWLKHIHIRNWGFDDSFFGYVYAKNLASGNGFTFNGEKVIGTSAPFPALFYAFASVILKFLKFKSEVNVIAEYLSIFSIIFTTIIAYLLLQKILKNTVAGIVGAVSLYFNPFYLLMFGHESILAISFLLLSVYLLYENKIRLSFFIFALAFLSRGETILLSPLFLIEFYRKRKIINWKKTIIGYMIFFVLPLVIWFSFSYMYFGQLTSNSMKFKILQTEISNTGFKEGAISFIQAVYLNKAGSESILGGLFLFAFSLMFSIESFRFFLISIFTIFAPIVFYEAIGISFYHWFLFLFVVGLSLSVGYSTGWLYKYFTSRNLLTKIYGYCLVTFVCLLTLFSNANFVIEHAKTLPYNRERAYQEVGFFLRDNTDKNSTVAFIEIGEIAYFSDRKIIDVTGITTKGVIEEYKKGNKLFVYHKYTPDYIIVDPDFSWLSDPTQDEIFKNNYQQIKVFTFTNYRPLYLYKRITN